MQPKSESTKNIPKASVEDEASLDCEAYFSLKLKKVEKGSKLCFFAYVLLATLLSQNNLLLPLREAFLFFFGE